MNKIKLHLGCGTDYKPGYINCDIPGLDGEGNSYQIDKLMDLNKYPYPIKDDSVDEIYSHHVFEHLDFPEKAIEECYRILRSGGKFILIVPYKSLGGTIHKHSLCYGWAVSFRQTPKNVWGREVSRKELGSGWMPVSRFYSSVEVTYQNLNPFKKIFFSWLLPFINSGEFGKKFYEEVLSDSIRFNQMTIIMRK